MTLPRQRNVGKLFTNAPVPIYEHARTLEAHLGRALVENQLLRNDVDRLTAIVQLLRMKAKRDEVLKKAGRGRGNSGV